MNAGGSAVRITGLGFLGAPAGDVGGFTEALRTGRTALVPAPDGLGPALHAPAPSVGLGAATAAMPGLPEPVRLRALQAAGRSPQPVAASVVAALEAWLSAGLDREPLPPHRVGLVAAGNNTTEHYTEQARHRYLRNPVYLPARYGLHHQDTDCVATVSRVLATTGEGFTVGGASAGGNVALVQGCRLVETGAVDACLVIGVLHDLSPLQLRGYLTLGAMARAGEKDPPGVPFDRSHRGFSPGEAAAAVLLESARSAAARGVRPRAEIRGYHVGLDANNLADPSAAAEADAMRRALARAGADAAEVDYVNTHGTGSPLGDRTEIDALRAVFGDRIGAVRLNATKGLTGHCLGAAGVVEAVAVAVQLSEGFLHPDPGLTDPIAGDCRFVPAAAEHVECGLALSNGFGFGGFNTSVVFARSP